MTRDEALESVAIAATAFAGEILAVGLTVAALCIPAIGQPVACFTHHVGYSPAAIVRTIGTCERTLI